MNEQQPPENHAQREKAYQLVRLCPEKSRDNEEDKSSKEKALELSGCSRSIIQAVAVNENTRGAPCREIFRVCEQFALYSGRVFGMGFRPGAKLIIIEFVNSGALVLARCLIAAKEALAFWAEWMPA